MRRVQTVFIDLPLMIALGVPAFIASYAFRWLTAGWLLGMYAWNPKMVKQRLGVSQETTIWELIDMAGKK